LKRLAITGDESAMRMGGRRMTRRSHLTLASRGVGPITVSGPMKQPAKQANESEKGSKPKKVNLKKRSTCALQCDETEPAG